MAGDGALTSDSTANSDPSTTSFDLMTVNDVAALLRVSKSWVYEHARDDVVDRLPYVKLGKYLRFTRSDLSAYLDAKRLSCRLTLRRR
jgi:excisionase family DNA binding protein